MSLSRFTVVMSVYHADCPILFQKAVDSVLNQTLKPTEVIIVADGPVGDKIEKVLIGLSSESTIKIIRCTKNGGLAVSRKIAIAEVSTEYVAVMDSDDICEKDRFEIQMAVLSDTKIDVVGGWVKEFQDWPNDMDLIRTVPQSTNEMWSYGKWRSPCNHVTLMFKKKSYDSIGGYSNALACEDWEMLSRMLVGGLNICNVPKVLVHCRGGDSMVSRRRTSRQIFGESKGFYQMYKNGYFSLFHVIANISVRVILRILPSNVTKFAYERLLRAKNYYE
jgi:glycosyltransferase involved in cell wall biosynthesis